MENNRLFITGMGGMEGRALASEAVKRGYRVSGSIHKKCPSEITLLETSNLVTPYSVDLRDYDETHKVLTDSWPRVIVHLAGHALDNSNLGKQVYRDNMDIFSSVMAATERLYKVGHHPVFILASGGIVYGRPQTDDPVYETDISNLPEPNYEKEFYRASKIDQERKLASTDLIYVIGRPGQHTGPGRIPNVVEVDIAKAIIDIKNEKSSDILVKNKLAEVNMLDGRDVANAYLTLIENGKTNQAYNISSDQSTRVEDLARMLIEVAGLSPSDYPILSTGPEQLTYARFSNEKIRELGWRPQYSLREALTSFWNDFKTSLV